MRTDRGFYFSPQIQSSQRKDKKIGDKKKDISRGHARTDTDEKQLSAISCQRLAKEEKQKKKGEIFYQPQTY